MSSPALFGYDPDTGEAWEEEWWRKHLSDYLANEIVRKDKSLQNAYETDEEIVGVRSKAFASRVLEPARLQWRLYTFCKKMRRKIDAAERMTGAEKDEFKEMKILARQLNPAASVRDPAERRNLPDDKMQDLLDQLEIMYYTHMELTRGGEEFEPSAFKAALDALKVKAVRFRDFNSKVYIQPVIEAAKSVDEDDFMAWNALNDKADELRDLELKRAYIVFVAEARRMALYHTEKRLRSRMRASLVLNVSKLHRQYWLERLGELRLRREAAKDEQLLRCPKCGGVQYGDLSLV